MSEETPELPEVVAAPEASAPAATAAPAAPPPKAPAAAGARPLGTPGPKAPPAKPPVSIEATPEPTGSLLPGQMKKSHPEYLKLFGQATDAEKAAGILTEYTNDIKQASETTVTPGMRPISLAEAFVEAGLSMAVQGQKFYWMGTARDKGFVAAFSGVNDKSERELRVGLAAARRLGLERDTQPVGYDNRL